MKGVIKVIKSLEKRGILLKGTTRKYTSQKGPFLNLLRPLMKNITTPLAKSALIPLILTAAASATDATIQKKIHGSGTVELIFQMKKWEM